MDKNFKMVSYINGVEIDNMVFDNEEEVRIMYGRRIDEGYAVRIWENDRKLAYTEAEKRYRKRGTRWLVRGERMCM